MKIIASLIIGAIAITVGSARAESCDQDCDCRKQIEQPAAKAGPPGVPADVFNRIRAKAAAEWPDNYSMQKYEIRTEVEAYRALHE